MGSVSKKDSVIELPEKANSYQMIVWAMILGSLFHVGMIQQFNIMIAYTPPHHCKLPERNWTWAVNESIPMTVVKTKLLPEKCQMYVSPANHSLGTTKCTEGWTYIRRREEVYPSNEFNLVCDHRSLVNLALTITFVGVMIGGIVFGFVADKFGRKPTLIFTLSAMTIFSISIFFAPNYESFVGFRFILGVFNQGIQTTCLTYNSELFPPKLRAIAGAAIGIMWATMLIILAMMFYYIGNWRYVHLIMGFLTAISAIYIWFIPESARWLVTKGRTLEAELILERLSGGAKNSEAEKQQTPIIHPEKLQKSGNNMFDLFRRRGICLITLALMYIWFTNAAVVFGISFSIPSLGGDMYLNFIICGIIEVLTRIIALYFIIRIGRIKFLFTVMFTCGVLTITAFLLRFYASDDDTTLQYIASAAALIGRNLIAVNFTITTLFTSELFPTTHRSTGVGLGFTAARLGNVVTPQILNFGREIWEPLPQIIYGGMAVLAAFITLTLPETNNRPLPTTIEDVEKMTKRKQYSEDCTELSEITYKVAKGDENLNMTPLKPVENFIQK